MTTRDLAPLTLHAPRDQQERPSLIADAIAETHDEIFRAAFNQEPDENDGDS